MSTGVTTFPGRLLLAAGLFAVLALSAAPAARAAGNASAAAGFLEEAQNKDGGFGARQHKASQPLASLWASLGLLAAGKNPRDEFLKNGKSAEQYLVAHRGSYSSLREVGLVALVQSTAQLGASRFGNPADRLRAKLSAGALRADPQGGALAVFGLLATGGASDRRLAQTTARTLLSQRTSDGAWGPNGNADSASTALVLQALARTGTATAASPEAKSGLAYLRQAQGNDGSIASSTRVDKAAYGGSVAATAFTVQAVAALRAPPIATPTGKTPRQGLAQYQQQGSGGLTSRGSQYSPVPPSVVETAQAYPAFDGKTFPLAAVAARTKGPDFVKRTQKKGMDGSSKRVSSGSAQQGVGGSDAGAADDPGAFRGATAGGNGKRGRAPAGAGGRGKKVPVAPKQAGAGGGGDVSGRLVGTGPRLATKAGASDTGLTPQQRSALTIGGILVVLFVLGALAEHQRPRPAGASLAATGALVMPVLRGAGRASGIAAVRRGESVPPRQRWPVVALLVLGLALIAVPFATGMFDRAPKGAKMVEAFGPYMTAERMASFKGDLARVGGYARELDTPGPRLLAPGLAPAQARARLRERNAQVAIFTQQWPAVQRTFRDLLGRIDANRENYRAVAALPPFGVFPWAFVVPGALMVALALAGLLFGRVAWLPLRRGALALGVLLALAPLVLQLPIRGPQGQDMVSAFKRIENRAAVQRVQGDFGTITVGRGAIGEELLPALRRRGLSAAQIRRELPATARLNDHWIHVLNDMTPMVGAMSDNVANYRAVAALPPFSAFTWLFLVPGLLAIGLVLLAGGRPRSTRSGVRSSEPVTT